MAMGDALENAVEAFDLAGVIAPQGQLDNLPVGGLMNTGRFGNAVGKSRHKILQRGGRPAGGFRHLVAGKNDPGGKRSGAGEKSFAENFV